MCSSDLALQLLRRDLGGGGLLILVLDFSIETPRLLGLGGLIQLGQLQLRLRLRHGRGGMCDHILEQGYCLGVAARLLIKVCQRHLRQCRHVAIADMRAFSRSDSAWDFCPMSSSVSPAK